MNTLRRLVMLSVALASVSLGGLLVGDASAPAALQYPLVREINAAPAANFGANGVYFVALDGETVLIGNYEEFAAFDQAGGFLWSVGNVGQVGPIATDEATGDVYVIKTPGEVGIYSSDGAYVSAITAGSVPTGLKQASTVAVDQADGDLYVYDNGSEAIDVFTSSGEYLFQISSAGGRNFGNYSSLAVDDANGTLLVSHSLEGERSSIYVLNASSGAYLTTWTGANTPQGAFNGYYDELAADNTTGDVYVETSGAFKTVSPVIDRFSSVGEYKSQIRGAFGELFPSTEKVHGLAVNQASGEIYVGYHCRGRIVYHDDCSYVKPASVFIFAADPVGVPHVGVEAATSVTSTSVTLRGTANPEETGEATCEFEYGETPSYGQRVPCKEPVANGNASVPVQAELTGLSSGTTYYFRLDGKNVADGGVNVGEYGEATGQFATLGPRVVSEGVASVNGEAVSVTATIDPNGTPTSAYFEYGTSESYGAAAPAPPGVALGAGTTDLELIRHVQGLQPSTEYHYRLVMLSEVRPGKTETIYGEDHVFRTQTAGGSLSLLDGRQWELVSPANKLGALIEPLSTGAVQAAVTGDAIAYQTASPTEGQPQGYSHVEAVLSTRGPQGWSSRDISAPLDQSEGTLGLVGSDFQVFSPDLSLAALRPVGTGFTPLSPEASESTPYLRSDFAAGRTACTTSCYLPLVTSANTPPGTVFGEEPSGECLQFACGPKFWGASPDLSHVVLSSPAQLTETPVAAGGAGLYEWAAGRLQLIGVLPKGEEGPAILGGSSRASEKFAGVRHAVSDDGERVILEAGSIGDYQQGSVAEPDGSGLYLRDVVAGETIRLDVVQGGRGPSEGEEYVTASSDASRIFFLDKGRLTAESSASGEDLYEYNLTAPVGKRLIDLTADPNAGEGAGVQRVFGASEDGSYVYFMATGVLAQGAQLGRPNLYVRHEGETKLIAVLSAEDFDLYGKAILGRVSPNGEWLAFMSHESLTGYDTRDVVSGQPDAEVYLYGSAHGRLVCASCNPTGARPAGVLLGAAIGSSIHPVIDDLPFTSQWVAANVPPWLGVKGGGNYGAGTFYQPRYLSNSGRLFFNSPDALVAQDVNATQDVYEFEPVGVSGCSASSALFVPGADGCLGLMSSGTSPAESGFLDASETGGDVFFITQARLVQQDYDTAYDVYDAQECTGAVPCQQAQTVPPPCETEASCRTAPSPQPALYGAPSSATFSGMGNFESASTQTVKAKRGPKRRAKAVRCKSRHGGRKRKGKGKARCVKAKKHGRARGRVSGSRRGGVR